MKALQVDRSHAGDDSCIRLRNFCQRGNLSGMGHSHFNHRDLVLGLNLQQHKRHAKVIIEVSFRLQNTIASAEQMRNRFFRCCFASRAGDSNNGFSPQTTHARSQCLQGNQRVVDRDQASFRGVPCQLILAHNRCYGTARQRLRDIIMAIQALALHGEKQFSRQKRARVDGISLRDQASVELAVRRNEFSNAGKRQLHSVFPKSEVVFPGLPSYPEVRRRL